MSPDLALLPWVPLLPLLSSLLLLLFFRMPHRLVTVLGVGSVAGAALVTALVGWTWLQDPRPYTHVLWTWMSAEQFAPRIALYLDGLSLTMLGVITGVGALIHSFAAGYMKDDPGYRRFFAYMNLFVAMMIVLVLGDNLLSLYLGWEGVGLCSYLLIGFFYQDPANGYAARKAFVVTRVGDTLMAIGLFVLYQGLQTLDIQQILRLAPQAWGVGDWMPTLIALLLLGGAVGKSAQLPLQTWLPDAMAGPTPVSALIHAATMVTAGVYLIARLHGIYLLSPEALALVGWIGALTLLLAGIAALVQTDIKRILAYSTMSQIGYMFLALGAGAWSAGIFHLMTHAFFKALLFLAAGSVILALHHEQDIFRMGGLRKRLPLVFWSFLIGSGALAAVPFVTSGFYSKEAILIAAWAAGRPEWWLMGVVTAFLTGLYIFRLVFIVFLGEERTHAHPERMLRMDLPLMVLLVLSIVGGFIVQPLAGVLPASPEVHGHTAHVLEIIASLAGLAGIGVAWLKYGRGPVPAPAEGGLRRMIKDGVGFDALYDALFVRPILFLARIGRPDWVDETYAAIAQGAVRAHRWSLRSQNGRTRWYAAGLATGLVIFVGVVLWI